MKTILIIGADMDGLAAGIYGQANGFKTTIVKSHSLPGGECTSCSSMGLMTAWRRLVGGHQS
jgi:phytoene dehydrogenase-like protein